MKKTLIALSVAFALTAPMVADAAPITYENNVKMAALTEVCAYYMDTEYSKEWFYSMGRTPMQNALESDKSMTQVFNDINKNIKRYKAMSMLKISNVCGKLLGQET